MDLLLPLLAILLGFAGLIWSADKFVLGASTTAKNLGVSPLMIGLTIVAFGTSAPEIFTSAVASLKDSPDIALGNALGSNIANIGLVLGITVLVCPMMIPMLVVKKELPALVLLTLACFFLLADLRLDYLDGLVLLAILCVFAWIAWRSNRDNPDEVSEEVGDYIADMSTLKASSWMLFSLALIIVSSNILVNGAREIALALGVSELVIGLTIVAIGTSLPELATSIASVLRRHHDLAIGNIIGSNIFNLLLVLPVPALIAPFPISPAVLWRDYSTMLILTLLLAVMMLVSAKRKGSIGRLSGSVLLLLYLTYTGFLLYNP